MLRALILAGFALVWAGAAVAEDTPTMRLTGVGAVAAKPDMATITIGVQTEAETATDALNRNTDALGGVIATIVEAGVDRSDLQTGTFAVNPVYKDRKSLSSGGPAIEGYLVTNEVRARVRSLSALGNILDDVISAGANRSNGLSFGFSEETELRDQARQRAVEDAKRKAELYAAAAGVALGPVISIVEGGVSSGPQMAMMEARGMSAVPIEPGSQEISAAVTITWAISAR